MATFGSNVCLVFLVCCLLCTIMTNASQLDPLPAPQDDHHQQQQQQHYKQQQQQQQHQQQQPALSAQDNNNNNNNNFQNMSIPRSGQEPALQPLPTPRNNNNHNNNNNNNNHHHLNPPNNNNKNNNNNHNRGVGADEPSSSPGIGPIDPRGDDQSRRHRRRNRRCKCVKRFMKEVDQLIDERLENFEHKYLRQANLEKERALALQNDASSTTSRIQGLDKAMLTLNADVLLTKETLAMMNSNLEVLRHEMNSTRGDVRSLNESFKVLNGAVDNLSRFVNRVERMIPVGLTKGGADSDRLGFGFGLGLGGLGGGGADLEADPLQTYPRNCDEVYRQGGMQFQGDYYIMIKPDEIGRPFKVLCKIFNNSGWTVIQKRQDGSVDFFRTWQEYRKGFGSLEGEFWLGNDYIHHLSVQEPTKLRIELTDWEDRTYYAEYDSFRIDNEKGLYRLHIGNYHGDAGDSLRSHWENHDGMPFSTQDRDNDGRYYDSCAEHFHGAWWFNNCFDSHLNGKYYHKGFHKNYFQRDGIQWNTIHMYSSLKSVCMMIKPAVSVPAASRPPAAVGPASSSSSSPSAGAGKRSGGKRNKRGRSRGKGRRASRKDRKKE